MRKYAILDENNICNATLITAGEIAADNYIEVDVNEEVAGKRYENGEWVEEETKVYEEPTQLDRIEEAVAKREQDIIDEYTLELIEGGVI